MTTPASIKILAITIENKEILTLLTILATLLTNNVAVIIVIFIIMSFFLLDLLTGVYKAKIIGSYHSRIFKKKGLSKLVAYMLIIASAIGLDLLTTLLPYGDKIGHGWIILAGFVLVYYDIGSIIENQVAIGANVPQGIKNLFSIENNTILRNTRAFVFQKNEGFDFRTEIDRIRELNVEDSNDTERDKSFKTMFGYAIDSFEELLIRNYNNKQTNVELFISNCEGLIYTAREKTIDKVVKLNVPENDKAKFLRGYIRREKKLNKIYVKLNETKDINIIKTYFSETIMFALQEGINDCRQYKKYDNKEIEKIYFDLLK